MNKLKIGSDPEFLFLNNHGLLSANAVFYHNDKKTKNGSYGVDGRSSTAELRPKASDTPEQHFEKISGLVYDILIENEPKLLIGIGGSFYKNSIGGHIHFSLKPTKQMIRWLNTFCGLPLFMYEGDDNIDRRKMYGMMGDYREKSWGFEYRTPCSWLTSKFYTKISLILGYITVHEYINNFTKDKDKMAFILDYFINENIIDFNNNNKNKFLKAFRKSMQYIRTFELYNKYKKEIENYYWLIMSRKTYNKYDMFTEFIDDYSFKLTIDDKEYDSKFPIKVLLLRASEDDYITDMFKLKLQHQKIKFSYLPEKSFTRNDILSEEHCVGTIGFGVSDDREKKIKKFLDELSANKIIR